MTGESLRIFPFYRFFGETMTIITHRVRNETKLKENS